MRMVAFLAALISVSGAATAQDAIPPFKIVFHPATLRAFGWFYRYTQWELPICLHGQFVAPTDSTDGAVYIGYITLPDLHPDSIGPRQVGGFRCLAREIVGLAHAHHDDSPESLPWRCDLSVVDRRNFTLGYPVQIVMCDYGVIGIHWPTGHSAVCQYDPAADPPVCRPYSGGKR
ncbi:MAG: hypothetical protein KatS3mg109_2081 [Pirellulaceae bacterium]|nr:MAG: hypothetical protein KatS3mg109_0376 [Pirellulaceae bacterium]GIW91549.1 MAG: hypothetical protein KatS3mg109_1981 [Pirellulaceae bacterium]GIW91649.1 MAG: hypothetical protein KatS3mg109_2081 [Pirellulaceae bacterium]